MILARLLLLGEPRLTAGPDPHASPIDLPNPVWLLLAYLVLHSKQPVDRRKLAFLLWADTTEALALRNLRQHLHRLRQVLTQLGWPADQLTGKGNQLIFDPAGLWIDLARFEQQITDPGWQIEALELYRGELLAGYEAEWLFPFRARLREQYLEALRHQITLATMQRNYPRAVHYAGRLLAATPLRESSHRIYMEALYLSGRRVQALKHFERLKQHLKQELNAAPMPQTVNLYRQMQRGALLTEAPRLILAPQQIAPAEFEPPLIGRENELAVLDEALVQSLAGRGQFILIGGEIGLGKTALLEAWGQTRAGQMLLFDSPVSQEISVPGESILIALSHGLARLDWPQLPQAWRRAMQACWPAIETVIESNLDLTNKRHGLPSLDQLRQMLLTLANHAKQPVALLLDDLHLADETTWQLLAFWGRRCESHRLLIVGTYRPRALSETAQSLVHSLQRHKQLRLLNLQPLTPAHITKLARQLDQVGVSAQDTSFINRLYRLTEGNPFFITEILQNLPDSAVETEGPGLTSFLPASIKTALAARFDQLSAQARQLLAIAATAGRAFNFRVVVGTMPEIDEETALAALESWLRRGLVRETMDGYEFTYDLIRLMIYHQLEPAQRCEYHQRVATALTSLALEPRLRDPARLAYHYLRACEPIQALPYLVEAGRRDLALGSVQEARHLAEQGLAALLAARFEPETLLEQLEVALEPGGELAEAYGLLEKMAGMLREQLGEVRV